MANSEYASRKRVSATDYIHGEEMTFAKNPRKRELLAYLKGFPIVAAAACYTEDMVAGEDTRECLCAYDDGEYCWDTRDIYHLEQYDLELAPEFCEHVLGTRV